MKQAFALLDAKNVGIHVPYFMSLLARIHARVGSIPAALALCSEALERLQRTEQHIWLAEAYRIEAEVRRAAGLPSSVVEESFGRALEVSRKQGARMFELRAATDLARLWCDQRRNVEARDLLAPIYAWFTEGFDTVDLQAGNALLAELRA